MSREIKFRAWDNKDYMSNPFSLDDVVQRRIEFTSDCIIMQYTGLKDKNGKEIYEGDIIWLINDAGETIMVVCKYGIARRYIVSGKIGAEVDVEVDIPCFYFELPSGKKTFPIVNNYAGKHDLELFEIIGNIYEHPKLIATE